MSWKDNNYTPPPFNAATAENFLGDLYAALEQEIAEHFPEYKDDITFYFDTDHRPLKDVLSSKISDPEMLDELVMINNDALASNSAPQALSYIDPEAENRFKTVITLRNVEQSFDPSQYETLIASPSKFAASLPKAKRPMEHPHGTPFWLEAYQTMAKHIHAAENKDRYMRGEVQGDNIETNMFADTFMAYALYKRFGPEIIPSLEHYANLRVLYVLTSGNPEFYSTPALQRATREMRTIGVGMRSLSLDDIAGKAENITNKVMEADPEILGLQRDHMLVLDPTLIRDALDQGAMNKYLSYLGFSQLSMNWHKAREAIVDLAEGINPYPDRDL